MMSIAKVGRGRQSYYLATVASGRDHAGGLVEPDGEWLGSAAGALGLSGAVTAGELDAVLAGVHPATGEVLSPSHRNVRVAGLDCTFSPPKSVSLLHALGPAGAGDEARKAHESAVRATVDYLDHAGARVRRGGSPAAAGAVHPSSFAAAAFLHRASRAPDPHLHTHVLVANCGPGPDGRWSALDGRAIYRQVGTATHLYEAQLRQEVCRRLGLEWTSLRGSWADLEGFDRALLRAFSRRSIEIEEMLAEKGLSGPRARRIAALATRAPKDLGVAYDELVEGWRERSIELGVPVGRLGRMVEDGERRLSRTSSGAHPPAAGNERSGALAEAVLGPEGITSRRASFTREDVIKACCRALPEGASVREVERRADALLSSPEVVERDCGQLGLRGAGGARIPLGTSERLFTTTAVVRLEEEIATRALEGKGVGVAVAADEAVDAACRARPELDEATRAAIGRITSSGNAVDILSSPTVPAYDALDAARASWAAGGTAVIGVAPSRRVAERLETSTGIETIALTRSGLGAAAGEGDAGRVADHLRPGTVLVVAGADRLAPPRLASLLALARQSRAKAVLVSGPSLDGPDQRALRLAASAGLGVAVPTGRPGTDAVRSAPTEPASPSIHAKLVEPGGIAVALASTAAASRQWAVSTWRELAAQGRNPVLVADDRAVAAEIERSHGVEAVFGPECAEALERTCSSTLVVLGSASCLPSEIRRRASIGRTHVVVDGGDEAGRSAERAAEVALPPRLLRRIGTPGRSFEDRAAWRDRAAAVELGATRQPGRDRGLGI